MPISSLALLKFLSFVSMRRAMKKHPREDLVLYFDATLYRKDEGRSGLRVSGYSPASEQWDFPKDSAGLFQIAHEGADLDPANIVLFPHSGMPHVKVESEEQRLSSG